MWLPLWSMLVRKIPHFFGQKLAIWTAHHTFLESRHPEVTKNLYYVLSTRRGQTPIVLGFSSWATRKNRKTPNIIVIDDEWY